MSAQVVRSVQYSMFGILAAVVAGGLYGCAEETDPEFPLHPFVEITSGPIEGGTVSYAIRIAWEGSDPDGLVDRFEYAVDPAPEFSEADIGGKTVDVTVETIQGESGEPDVTRISKVVGGKVVSFDWAHTHEFSRLFRFATPEADSTLEGGGQVPTGRFTGMHAVYVRAVDNDGLYSNPDQVAFTAETVAPSSEIVRPNIEGEIYNMGNGTIVGWEGTDPDGLDPEKKPARFVYKLLRLDTLDPPINLSGVSSPQILYVKGDPTWADLPTDENSVEFVFDNLPGQYVFGIRAVDEAGAVEPFLNFGRNAFKFQAFEGGAIPNITVDIDGQVISFWNIKENPEVEVVAGQEISITVSCDASGYGEKCVDWRWGLDVPDLPGDEGWSDWVTDPTLVLQYGSVSIHVLYVEVRDSLGHSFLATIIINVVELIFDRDVLYVDDSFDDLYPRDGEHDAFWRSMIEGYGGFAPGDVGEHHAHLDNDRGALYPVAPLLEELGRHRILIWDVRGSGYNGSTALLKSIIQHRLQPYLMAGGKLWLSGTRTDRAMAADNSSLCMGMVCERDRGPGDFSWDFMKIHAPRIMNDGGREARNNLIKVRPFPDREKEYPEMDVDLGKRNPAAGLVGISGCEALFHPILAHSEDGFRGVVDSLYVYGSVAAHLDDPPTFSTYEGRLNATRWHDPDPAREQGRVQWFGFPLYFFEDSQAQETFNRSMDWFREEESPVNNLRRTRP